MDSQVPDSSSSLSLLSEPPAIRNWFPSYKYESFVLDTYDDIGGSIFKESDGESYGRVAIGERQREKEENLDQCSSDSDDKHEELSSGKMPDSLDSPSLLSEPPHMRNWFSSYVYESPLLGTFDDLKGSFSKGSEGEEDEFANGESNIEREEHYENLNDSGVINEVGSEKKLFLNGSVKHNDSFGDVSSNKPLSKISDSPQFSLLLSEPPDLGNWFSSYVYESPVLESNEFLHKKAAHEEDDLIGQDSNREKEMKLWKSGQITNMDEVASSQKVHSNGFLKINSSLEVGKLEAQPLNKGNRGEDKSSLSNLEDKPFLDHETSPTKDVKISSLKDYDYQCKQKNKQIFKQEADSLSFKCRVKSTNNDRKSPSKLIYRKDLTKNLKVKSLSEVDLVSPGSNMNIQVTAPSMRKSAQESDDKENEGNKVSENGFVTTRKSRITRPSNESYLNKQQEVLIRCSSNKVMTSDGEKDALVKRKVLAEKTNFGHAVGIEITGKWKCPQKSKPNTGPPMKQLRLEQWVRKL